jgi:hypothetical protein
MSKDPRRHTPQPYGHATPWSRRAAAEAASAAEHASGSDVAPASAPAPVSAPAFAPASGHGWSSTPAQPASGSDAAPAAALASTSALATAPRHARSSVPAQVRRLARRWPWAVVIALVATVVSWLVYDSAMN